MLGIVIPAYKREDKLKEALESLCGQTVKNFITIVVDDHSPVPLKSVVDKFRNKLHIIYIYAESNGGPGAARQLGLEKCYENKYDQVMFLDSDDKLFPHAVARLTHEMQISDADIVSSNIWREEANLRTGLIYKKDNKTWVHGKIYNVAYLQKNNIRFPKIRINEDMAFNLMAIELSKKVKQIDDVLYFFRYDANSLTKNEQSIFLCDSTEYIKAIYEAEIFLFPRIGTTQQMIFNIFSCYNRYQIGLATNVPMDEEILEKIRFLFNLPEVKETLYNPKKFKEVVGVFEQATVINDKIYFFPQTFKQWLDEVVYEYLCD